MSVESPEPRQRTVAELLAENGGAQSGRRRRRRADDDEPSGFAPDDAGRPGPSQAPFPPRDAGPPPRRPDAGPRYGGPPPGEPAPGPYSGRNGYETNGHASNGYAPNDYADRGAPPPSPPRGRPVTPPAPPPGYSPEPGFAAERVESTRAIPRGGPGRFPAEPQEAPTGAFGARTRGADSPAGRFGGPPPDTDGGPPTQLGAPPLVDDDVDDRDWTGEFDDGPPPRRRPAADPDAGPPTEAGFAPDELDEMDQRRDDDWYDDYDEYEDHGEREAGAVEEPEETSAARRRAAGRRAAVQNAEEDDAPAAGAAGTGQAWALVVVQLIGGAIVGAGIWLGFRYMWSSSDLQIVALALSVAITVGLVLAVRKLLSNDDFRTTMGAVLVGLLLTVSPALLVLLEK